MIKWIKKNLFSTPTQAVISLVLILILWNIGSPLFKWLFVDSVWQGTAETCRQAQGACLVFIREKLLFILFGFYPEESLWRPFLAVFLFLSFIFYSREPKRWSLRLLKAWLVFCLLEYWLLRGGFGFEDVDISQWGGLPLTLLIAFIGLVFSYPFGIILALARRSQMTFIRSVAVGYIEFIRGVPLISLLFMASVMLPLFLPEGLVLDKLLRALVAMIFFSSAYMAEVVRGGLASISKGQYEAAQALGLNYYQTMKYIILPQALKVVIPPTVNTAISVFKDTSLVLIIALFDLLMTTKTALQDSQWLGFSIEGYLFVALIYFVFCFSMGNYSRRLERELNKGVQQ